MSISKCVSFLRSLRFFGILLNCESHFTMTLLWSTFKMLSQSQSWIQLNQVYIYIYIYIYICFMYLNNHLICIFRKTVVHLQLVTHKRHTVVCCTHMKVCWLFWQSYDQKTEDQTPMTARLLPVKASRSYKLKPCFLLATWELREDDSIFICAALFQDKCFSWHVR